MITKTIILKNDIVIERGTIVPMLSPIDEPTIKEMCVKNGSKLIEWNGSGVIQTKDESGVVTATPCYPAIFRFLFETAIQDGNEVSVVEDKIKEFKMFEKIDKPDKYYPNEGNYICCFYCETIEEANKQAEKMLETSNLGEGFKYLIR